MYKYNNEIKEASKFVVEKNKQVLEHLDFDNTMDFDFASRGFIATLDEPVIKDINGKEVFNIETMNFVDGIDPKDAPSTVNPSLWRQAKLNYYSGLFKVCDGVYQIRSTDLATITAYRGHKGWVLVDTTTSIETAKASMDLLFEHVENVPVTAIIYSHSHGDHFGGVKGIVSEDDVRRGDVQIIAPYEFSKESGSEMVIAGPAMSRRAQYQFAYNIGYSPEQNLDGGLGPYPSTGTTSLMAPSLELGKDRHTVMQIDGLTFEFTEAHNTEAVSEHIIFCSDYKVLNTAEVVTHTLHNLLTPRGAQIRDSLKWTKVIQNMIELFGERTEYICATHHWPTFGHDECIKLLEEQRDIYQYMHNEVVRLLNKGVTIHELPYQFKLTPQLEKAWSTRGYYGSILHNVKAIYQFYLGWWDGNPATYLETEPTEAGRKTVEMFGGVEPLLEKLETYMEKGDFQWVADVLHKVVYAYPDHENAKFMLADALEQIGYTEESGIRRDVYLQGASELRNGIKIDRQINFSSDFIAGLTLELMLDFVGVSFNNEAFDGEPFKLRIIEEDTREHRVMEYTSNGVLINYESNLEVDLEITGNKFEIVALFKSQDIDNYIANNSVLVDGDVTLLHKVVKAMEEFTPDFAIMTREGINE